MFQKANNTTLKILILITVQWFAFFHNNGIFDIDIMEARNLVTAHEMVEYDNWLVPTMNGDLRLEKPPLPTWIAAVVEMASPDDLPLQRAAAGCMAMLLTLFLYLFVKDLTKNKDLSFFSTLILSTSYFVIFIGRNATWDIYCHAFMMGAILYLYRSMVGNGKHWKNMAISGLFMGLSFLSKGPVSFFSLLLPFLIALFTTHKINIKSKISPLVLSVSICLIISLWWPLILYMFHRDEALFVATKESNSWINRNVRPWYYYWSFTTQSGIWTLFFATALFFPYARKRFALKKEYTLVMIWTLASVILLSLFPEKKSRYLMPMLIPGAAVTAFYLHHIYSGLKSKTLGRGEIRYFSIITALIALIFIALPVIFYSEVYLAGAITLTMLIIDSIVFLAVAFALLYGLFKQQRKIIFGTLFSTMIVLECVALAPAKHLFFNPEMTSIRATREIKSLEGLPLYSTQFLRIELIYELGRRVTEWDYKTDNTPLNNLPIAVISVEKVEDLFPKEILETLEIEEVGRYNNNKKPHGHKKFDSSQIRYVSILRKR